MAFLNDILRAAFVPITERDGYFKVAQQEVLPTDTTKLNATTELGYNAANQLVRIRKQIDGIWYTKNVTGTEITDTVVAKTKTFSSWS